MSGGRKLDGPQVVVLAEFGAIPFKLFLSLTGVIRRPGEFLPPRARRTNKKIPVADHPQFRGGADATLRRSDADDNLPPSVYLILLQEAVDHSTIIMRAHVF